MANDRPDDEAHTDIPDVGAEDDTENAGTVLDSSAIPDDVPEADALDQRRVVADDDRYDEP